ncbi:transmembrane protein, putative (macronuclear) [Tetrahymena thermophila SB210]|uniref:Transmembrane protein, putative n=1 Tax=Tetrahymena thermophila (strain SB210) TaxID=312017 RepID=W7XDX7_TETTS|nr:transmembrane protein, putative [Tetrahymena thermophila SB210]EWS72111.1 transmembrane protein, putative [Tetrahymena thermophila SB210]|eukprot:XP_012655354.1 transmembrane protein, putative [Tetrahymena thermophila SB210]
MKEKVQKKYKISFYSLELEIILYLQIFTIYFTFQYQISQLRLFNFQKIICLFVQYLFFVFSFIQTILQIYLHPQIIYFNFCFFYQYDLMNLNSSQNQQLLEFFKYGQLAISNSYYIYFQVYVLNTNIKIKQSMLNQFVCDISSQNQIYKLIFDNQLINYYIYLFFLSIYNQLINQISQIAFQYF